MTFQTLPLAHRCVLSLTGPDTLTLLERLVTSRTADWGEGEARYGALLTPQGKVISDFLALRTSDGVWLDTDRAEAAGLAKRFQMFRLRSEVDIMVRSDLEVWISTESAPTVPPDTVHAFPDPRHPDSLWRLFRPVTGDTASAADVAAYHRNRIRLGLPEQGSDFHAAEVFPADINMDRLGGLDLKKGCFVGQEVVSRMHRRGTIRKRTVILEGKTLEPGLDLVCAERQAGQITSASAPVALGRLRLDRTGPGTESLMAGATTATLIGPEWLAGEQTALAALP
ncbi:MAG: YgfZ/GcvT domain-containing protein [Henriciella sp.]|jgi:folate-binding protein YgfZ